MFASRYVAVIFLLLCGNAIVGAQETPPVFSGPQPGESLPPLEVVLAYGEEAGHTVDLIELAAGKPALLVIVNGSNRPAARLTRILSNFAEMQTDKLFAGVAYLDKDLTAAVRQLKQSASWWKVGPPVGVSIDGAEGPGSYGLNRNVNLTILVANKGRVTSNFALVQPSETDAPKILEDVVALAGGRVPTQAEVLFLSVPTSKPPNVAWRNAPADTRLRELICTALAAKDTPSARAAAAAVEQYVNDDQDRQAILGNAAALLLQRKGRVAVGDIPIVAELRSWRDEYDPDRRQ